MRTDQAVFELDDVAVGDALENRDFGLEVLEELAGQLAPDDRLDRHGSVRILQGVERRAEVSPRRNAFIDNEQHGPSVLVAEWHQTSGGPTHLPLAAIDGRERPPANLLGDQVRPYPVLVLAIGLGIAPGVSP
jgi:hypothetical protein